MNKKILIAGIVATLLLLLVPSVSATWCDNDYGKKTAILINNTGGSEQTYYQVELNYSYDSDMNANFSDARVYNESDCSLVPLWNESAVTSSWNQIWFNVTYLSASSWNNDTYYLYYDYSPANSVSNITTTFIFGDDFSVDTFTSTDESTNPTRTADDAWEGSVLCEQSDFNYSGEYISWYRGHASGTYEVGFENSTDGITWSAYSGNPILSDPAVYAYVVQDGDCFYMFINNDSDGYGSIFLYNVTNHTNPIIMNNGNPVYNPSSTNTDWDWKIFNPGVTIDGDGRWHMLLEGKSNAGVARIGYAYSNLTEMDWSAHRSSSYVIDTAGNPYLKYVPDRNALLAIHGDISGSYWRIVSSYADLSDDLSLSASWHSSPNFKIAHSGIHTADPHAMFNFNATYPIMISYNYNQITIYQTYSTLSLNEFYDEITATTLLSKWEGDTSYGSVSDGVLTYEGNSNWRHIYSKTSFTPDMAIRTLAKLEGQNCEVGFEKTTCCDGRSIIYNQGLVTVDDSGDSETTNTGWNFNTWYTFDLMQISGISVELDWSGTPIIHTTYVGTIAQPAVIASYQAAATIWVDWIVVRKYQTTEPTAHLSNEESSVNFIPPDPISLQHTSGNFYVNYTWAEGTSNITDSYNVYNGTVWNNESSNAYFNESVSAGEWVNVTIYAWNSSGSGTQSAGNVSDQVQVTAADTSFTVTLPVGYTYVHFNATFKQIDYLTLTEEDPNTHLSVGVHNLDFDAYNNEDCYLYKDYGVDYFSDFEHKVDVKATGLDVGDQGVFWMLSNDIDDKYGLTFNAKTFLAGYFMNTSNLYILEQIGYAGYVDFFASVNPDTWYYLTIKKYGTAFTCKIYSDSARTTLVDTIQRTLHTDHKFRYLFACNTYNSESANVCTLNIENLRIDSEVSTQTNHAPDGQNSTTPFYNVTNTGTVNLYVRMQLNDTVSSITLKADNDNNPVGAKEVNATLVAIGSSLSSGNSMDIWLWSDFDHTTQQTINRTLYINVTDKSVIPPNPVNLQNSTGNFYVNYTWSPGSGVVTDGYNVTWNETWDNTSNTYMNKSVGASGWANITVYAFNSTGIGKLSTGSVSDQVQAPAAGGGTETLYAEDLTSGSGNTINSESNAYDAANGDVAEVVDLDNTQYVDAVIDNHLASGTVTSVKFKIKLKKGSGWGNDILDIEYTEDGSNWHQIGPDYTPQAALTWTENYTAALVNDWTKVDAMQVRIVGDQVTGPDSGNIEIDAYHIYVDYT